MCTVTIRCGGGSLLLTMNRDERWGRAPEAPPRLVPGGPDRPAWAAPFDGVTGGTWIGVNDRGVAACVLNGYTAADLPLRDRAGVPSRGSIIPRILEDQDGTRPARLRGALDFSAYASFTLVLASVEGGEIVRWRHGDGMTREEIATGWTFLTSSSWSEPEVAAWRRRAFDAWRAAGEPASHGLPLFQVATVDGDEAKAPFMTRDTSATRSVTQVRVETDRRTASLSWWPRPGRGPISPARPGAALDLDLVAANGGLTRLASR